LETLHAGEGQEALQALMGQDARRLLKEAILALPERKRQCVLLYYGRGLSLAEVAAVFDLTSARICQILSAARIDLRAALEGKISVEDLDGMDIAKVESS
jgi:RNA polymerase sigma factor for flagellar operon FliA